jgi:hypothetical protein
MEKSANLLKAVVSAAIRNPRVTGAVGGAGVGAVGAAATDNNVFTGAALGAAGGALAGPSLRSFAQKNISKGNRARPGVNKTAPTYATESANVMGATTGTVPGNAPITQAAPAALPPGPAPARTPLLTAGPTNAAQEYAQQIGNFRRGAQVGKPHKVLPGNTIMQLGKQQPLSDKAKGDKILGSLGFTSPAEVNAALDTVYDPALRKQVFKQVQAHNASMGARQTK